MGYPPRPVDSPKSLKNIVQEVRPQKADKKPCARSEPKTSRKKHNEPEVVHETMK